MVSIIRNTQGRSTLTDAACYCHYVPRMDPSRALDSRLEPSAWDITNQVMDSMKVKFRMANLWSIELARVRAHYARKRKEYKNAGGSPDSTASDNGGGLKEYSELLEAPHKQFGSLQHDKLDLTQPNDKPYSKLEHEEDSEDPATAQSPIVSFKIEGEELRRSKSTSTSIASTTFTPVNPNSNNATTPIQTQLGNNTTSNGARSSYGPSLPQPPHTYHNQPVQYGPSQGYGYPPSTPTYPQASPQYSHHTPYTPGSRPSHGPGSNSYDPVVLNRLEQEGTQGIISYDMAFRDGTFDPAVTGTTLVPDYLYQQYQSNYMPDSNSSYMYSNQWHGSG